MDKRLDWMGLRLERLCGFIVVKLHYSETFDPKEVVLGAGGDLGIDAIGILVIAFSSLRRISWRIYWIAIQTTWMSHLSSCRPIEF